MIPNQVRHAFCEIWAEELFEGWYNSPNSHLNMATPSQFVEAGDIDKVIEAINSTANGLYS